MLKPSVCRRSLGTRGLSALGSDFGPLLGRTAMEKDPRVTQIVVFGSYARGTATQSSDVDIAVFYDGEQRDSMDVVGNVAPSLWRRCRQHGLECDVVAFANDHEGHEDLPLVMRIREEGVDVTA